jgi:hypothetical protein
MASSVRKGDSITKVYTLLGRQDCTFFLGKEGKWRVKFVYPGCNGEFIEIIADAATGLVEEVANVAI